MCSTPTARESAERAQCRSAGGRSSSDTAHEAAHFARQPGTNHAAYRGRRFRGRSHGSSRGPLAVLLQRVQAVGDAGGHGVRSQRRPLLSPTAACPHRHRRTRRSHGHLPRVRREERDGRPMHGRVTVTPASRRRDASASGAPFGTRRARFIRLRVLCEGSEGRSRRVSVAALAASPRRVPASGQGRGRLWRGALARYPRVSVAERR